MGKARLEAGGREVMIGHRPHPCLPLTGEGVLKIPRLLGEDEGEVNEI